jgi:hypothetical protein
VTTSYDELHAEREQAGAQPERHGTRAPSGVGI